MLQGAYQRGYTMVLQGCESCCQMLCMHNIGLCRLTRVTSFHGPRCGCGGNRDPLKLLLQMRARRRPRRTMTRRPSPTRVGQAVLAHGLVVVACADPAAGR